MTSLRLNQQLLLFCGLGALASCSCGQKERVACRIGSFEAFFDEFDYNSTDVGSGGSIFGVNEWVKCTGSEQFSRAWYRVNHQDSGVSPPGFIEIESNRLVFRITGEYNQNQNWPAVDTGFRAKNGVYVARVRFSDLSEPKQRMQAFWAGEFPNVEANQETDFEWSNWIGDTASFDVPTLRASNLNGSTADAAAEDLDCNYYTEEQATEAVDCMGIGGSYIIGKPVPPKDIPTKPVENEFYNLMIRRYSDRVEYGGLDDGYRGVAGSVWTGSTVFGLVTVIDERIPADSLHPRFGLYKNSEDTTAVYLEDRMEVEWFYFSPAQELLDLPFRDALTAVEAEVAVFRAANAPRVNTTETRTHYTPEEVALPLSAGASPGIANKPGPSR